jgi:hypothetical protein
MERPKEKTENLNDMIRHHFGTAIEQKKMTRLAKPPRMVWSGNIRLANKKQNKHALIVLNSLASHIINN